MVVEAKRAYLAIFGIVRTPYSMFGIGIASLRDMHISIRIIRIYYDNV